MPVHQNKTLDPSHFVVIKPLAVRPPVGLKLQDWSSGKHGVSEPSREQVFRGNYHRRQQLSQQACRRPYGETGEPLYAESVKAFGSLKRVDEKTRNGWSASDRAISTAILKPTGRSMSPAREDSSTLKNHLGHVRRLMSAVRQGRGYFQLLQKEERELQEAQTMERRRREEKQRTECQPPCYDSDSDSESPLRAAFSAGGSRPIGGSGRRKKLPAGRPFTPLHHSLSSPQLGSVALEPLFRQLCCLNWLLEAVTLNPPGRTGPVSSCWDVTDPGRSRVTVKALNKEKAVEMRWDQFISQPKPRRAPSRGRCSFSGRPLRRVSVFSLASSSATTPTLRSLSSLALGPDEAPPPGGAAASEESSLQGPGEQIGGARAWAEIGHTFSGCCQRQFPSEAALSRQPVCEKQVLHVGGGEGLLPGAPQELTLSLNSSLDSRARNRWDSGVLTFRSLCRGGMSTPRSRPVTVTSGSRGVPEAVSRPCEDGVWLTRLIAGLPETALRDRRVGRILEKLRRFADGRSLRIRPPAFLKVLGACSRGSCALLICAWPSRSFGSTWCRWPKRSTTSGSDPESPCPIRPGVTRPGRERGDPLTGGGE
ncbi:hypothetical protein ANANG_G00188720 [Anguilla anguilla]|uniref:Uncharacterized protein n=1 Tax=Anguilla anguilla TaxID=7936 RepID=A0A9D3M2I5_ANGAN|nr:hypothetical protein ANANG_G00188720 [Anguilla anguilla]